MKAKWIGLALCTTLMITTGCQPHAEENGHTTQYSHTTQDSDAAGNKGIVQGKGYTSLYKDRINGESNDRGGRIFGFDRDLGTTRDYDLGKTWTPGTRIPQDHIPYGYASHAEDDADVIYQGYGANMYIDRQVIAEAVTQIVVGLQDVQAATAVVADDTCVIAYTGQGDQERLQEQVWKSGLSVTPRWFKVYTTNDPQMVQRLKNLGTNPRGHKMNLNDMGQEINNIIEEVAATNANQ